MSLSGLVAKLFLRVPKRRPCQGGPPSCFSECVPARVVRRPRHGRPPSSCKCQSAVPARVVRRPRQGRPPSCFSECVPARVVRRPRQGRPPSSLKDVLAPPGFSRWEIRVPNFTIVPHGLQCLIRSGRLDLLGKASRSRSGSVQWYRPPPGAGGLWPMV